MISIAYNSNRIFQNNVSLSSFKSHFYMTFYTLFFLFGQVFSPVVNTEWVKNYF